ncbi:uncharacterized protein LOC128174312 [Crassostrea angulata]|uniref:uncharacterized protein LOC128174312 n=1 Tax=Magallana angulata TaxID=2784310 RepID=UPI0022B21AC9|nr:uncharacterized protein LOC128174312 [Crassostrea angulata]
MIKLFLRYNILQFIWTILLSIHACRADLRSSYSQLHYGQKLERRMITSYDGYSILDCVEDCLRTTRCRSINYYQGAHFCQTNFEKRTTVPGLYIVKPGWIYSDIEDWDKEIAGACSRSNCRINEKCIPQPFDQFTCVISDCGEPRGEGFSMEHVREWDAIGITRGMHITCAAKYNQLGSELFVCRSNGTWRTDLSCHKNYENLSRRNKTVLTQSSTYRFNIASIANDGDVQTTEPKCAITALNHTKAWLQVDFGQPYIIHNVKIYHRREGDGPSAWKQYQFRQFYLDASNFSATQTTTSQRTRCYTDNTTAPDLPTNIIDIPCKQTARYVIVETTYDAPEDDYLDEHGAILEICEIKVYGCEVDTYGVDCMPCIGCQYCDKSSGVCDACEEMLMLSR